MYISDEIKHKIHHAVGFFLIIAGIFGVSFCVKIYPEVFKVSAAIEKGIEVKPSDSIIIKFSEPMMVGKIRESITINPQQEVNFSWANNNKDLVINPVTFWQPEQNYTITISRAQSMMFTRMNGTFSFATEKYPQVVDFYPTMGEKDVLLDIEDPISVTFDKPLGDFKAKFIIRPNKELAYQTVESSRVEILSKTEFDRGVRYEVETWVRYKDENENLLRKIHSFYFETKPLPPTTWEKDLKLRLEQAKRFTDPKIMTGKYIDINLKSQIMTIFENGKLLDAYLVSTGKRGMETKQGQFAVHNKFPRAWSKKYGLYMPYWMAMVPSGEFGIHELPEWPGGYKEGQNHLGIPVSHGCIRLGVGPAERVYNWAELKTPVLIHE